MCGIFSGILEDPASQMGWDHAAKHHLDIKNGLSPL